MDNRLFRVNGVEEYRLLQALKLVFSQTLATNYKCTSWSEDLDKGLILYYYTEDDSIPFPSSLDCDAILPIVVSWLKSDFASKVSLDNWCEKADVETEKGWVVYCEDWGKVGNKSGAICAIKPCLAWYGQ